jgi:hypothetical protein
MSVHVVELFLSQQFSCFVQYFLIYSFFSHPIIYRFQIMILTVPFWLALVMLVNPKFTAISQAKSHTFSHYGESSLFLECGLQVRSEYFPAHASLDANIPKSILAFEIESNDATMMLGGIATLKTFIDVVVDGITITTVALEKNKGKKQWKVDINSFVKKDANSRLFKRITHREVFMKCSTVRDTSPFGESWSEFSSALSQNSFWSLEHVDLSEKKVTTDRFLRLLVRRSLPPKRTRKPTRAPKKVQKVLKVSASPTIRKPLSVPSQYPTRPSPYIWVPDTPMPIPTDEPYLISQKPSSFKSVSPTRAPDQMELTSIPMAVSAQPSGTLVPTLITLFPVSNTTRNPTVSKMPSKKETKLQPSLEPTSTQSVVPMSSPLSQPTPGRSHHDGMYNLTVVLFSGGRLLRGDVVDSPSGEYRFGLSHIGNLEVTSSKTLAVIWRATLTNASSCYMQPDGNLVVKRGSNWILWQSHTVRNPGAILVLDDGGQVSIVSQGTVIWLAGLPRGQYSGPSSDDLTFPVRGVFYYPWYPQTWRVNGKSVFYRPSLGFYSNSDYRTHAAHVDALTFAQVDLSIASWWGPDTQLERARLTDLLSQSRGRNLKWSIYHEMELHLDPTIDEIREDLNYLKAWYTWHEGWAFVDGRPLVFVYNEGDCNVAERWSKASNREWYIVLKVFKDFQKCMFQPDHWHQYAPANNQAHAAGYSYSISPGFWVADQDKPKLPRLNASDWRQSVTAMVNSKEDWQLITTFNEWGEGTAVESAEEWSSESGYGMYLDTLRDIQ